MDVRRDHGDLGTGGYEPGRLAGGNRTGADEQAAATLHDQVDRVRARGVGGLGARGCGHAAGSPTARAERRGIGTASTAALSSSAPTRAHQSPKLSRARRSAAYRIATGPKTAGRSASFTPAAKRSAGRSPPTDPPTYTS